MIENAHAPIVTISPVGEQSLIAPSGQPPAAVHPTDGRMRGTPLSQFLEYGAGDAIFGGQPV